jgi:hypothetical protein
VAVAIVGSIFREVKLQYACIADKIRIYFLQPQWTGEEVIISEEEAMSIEVMISDENIVSTMIKNRRP